jgi:hypothetical protein
MTEDIHTDIESNISVAFCGPYEVPSDQFLGTLAAARSIKKALPMAEVLLVTWEDSIPLIEDRAVFDKVIALKDPGGTIHQKFSGVETKSNFCRMVYTGREAALNASRKWFWRIRTDCYVSGSSALKIYKDRAFRNGGKSRQLFQSPVLIPDLYTRNPMRGGRLFHPSDLMHLGLRGDILNLFESVYTKGFFQTYLSRARGGALQPEQLLWLSFVQSKLIRVSLKRDHSIRPDFILLSTELLLDNFWLASFSELDASFKKPFNKSGDTQTCFTVANFYKMQRRMSRPLIWTKIEVLLKTWGYWVALMFQYKIGPILFDWSREKRHWKAALLQQMVKKLIRK